MNYLKLLYPKKKGWNNFSLDLYEFVAIDTNLILVIVTDNYFNRL